MTEVPVLVVPAYRPDAGFPERVSAWRAAGFARIVAVDDGSGAEFAGVFASLEAVPGCVVLRHETNRGKGAALRTALAHVAAEFPQAPGVVTADADGQHAPDDCWRVAERLVAEPEALVLGTRDFRLFHVPFRSWVGNTWTAVVFSLLYGRRVPDTQTGLRGIPQALLTFANTFAEDGYALEMAMLCRFARRGVRFVRQPIATIYQEGNASSHFDPLRDTLRIQRVLFACRFERRR